MIENVKNIASEYLIEDSRNLDSRLPSCPFIDVTITSPPYWNLKDYGNKKQIGFGQTYDRYLDDLDLVFSAMHSRTVSTGSLWIVADTFKIDGQLTLLPFDIAKRLKQNGWFLQDVIIWQKDKTLPWSHQGKLRNIFGYVICFSKTRSNSNSNSRYFPR